MDGWFQSRFTGLSTVQTLYSESHKRSKMIEAHFYRLYSIMIGSKIIAVSPSKVWHLIYMREVG